MLACYPIEATEENWLHDTIVGLVNKVHQRLGLNQPISETHTEWKSLIPSELNDFSQKSLKSSTGIRDRLFKYQDELKGLSIPERELVLVALNCQNNIAALLSGTEAITTIENDFPTLNDAVKDLFVFCYEKLTDFKVRERQYQIVFAAFDTKFCPICGIERLMNPEETAQDQDHYLAKSIYPFAAVNMRNLIPMCRCCNRDYKKDQDIIRDEQAQRRKAFDPFCCQPTVISLINSEMNNKIGRPVPSWQIDFIPNCEETETWDHVFSIRIRYERDVLNQYFDVWLKGFVEQCKRSRRDGRYPFTMTDNEVQDVLVDYQEYKEDNPAIGLGFLEPKVFAFLLHKFKQGNQRVIQLIRDAVVGIDPEFT